MKRKIQKQEPGSYNVSMSQDKHGIGQKKEETRTQQRSCFRDATSAYYAHIFDDILNGGAHPIMVLTDLHQEVDEFKLCKGTGRGKKIAKNTSNQPFLLRFCLCFINKVQHESTRHE